MPVRSLLALAVLSWSGMAYAQGLSVSVGARAMQPGEVIALTITAPDAVDSMHVNVFERSVPAFRTDPRTWRALVGIDLDVKPGAYEATVEGHATGTGATTPPLRGSARLTVRAKHFTTRRLRVDPDYVDPPSAVVTRILDEAARLDAMWQGSTHRKWTGPFVPPVAAKPVGRFGARSVFNGQPRAPHGGDDYPEPVGARIVAPGSGEVVLADDLYFTGNTVVVDHGLGLYSLFAHLSAMYVAKGDMVTGGQALGLVGATGRVTGPHLHWSVRLGGARVDPSSLLRALGATSAPVRPTRPPARRRRES